jgi:hypothetical protein
MLRCVVSVQVEFQLGDTVVVKIEWLARIGDSEDRPHGVSRRLPKFLQLRLRDEHRHASRTCAGPGGIGISAVVANASLKHSFQRAYDVPDPALHENDAHSLSPWRQEIVARPQVIRDPPPTNFRADT